MNEKGSNIRFDATALDDFIKHDGWLRSVPNSI